MLDPVDAVFVTVTIILIGQNDDLAHHGLSSIMLAVRQNAIIATPLDKLVEGDLLDSMPCFVVGCFTQQLIIVRIAVTDMCNNGELGSANERKFICGSDSVLTKRKGSLDDLEEVLVRDLWEEVLDDFSGLCVDGNLIFLYFQSRSAILVDSLKELVVVWIIGDDTATTGQTNAIFSTYLCHYSSGEMITNSMDLL